MEEKSQMSWQLRFAWDGPQRLELYWRANKTDSWHHYSESPYRQPDLTIPGASKGWTTMQALKARGWQFVDRENNPIGQVLNA